MALEGVSGAVTSFQTQPAAKLENTSKENSKPEKFTKTVEYSDNDGTVSEVSLGTVTVKNAGSTEEEKKENEQRRPSEETVKQTISDINKRLNNHTECRFGVHDKTNRVMIQIINKDTQEVIKEIPPEKTLDMIAKAWELAGILVDEKL